MKAKMCVLITPVVILEIPMRLIHLVVFIIFTAALSSCGVSGNKIPGSPGYVEPPNNITAPSAPDALTVSVLTVSRVYVQWSDNSISETGFDLERATIFNGSQSGFVMIAQLGPNKSNFTDEATQAERTYVYRVRAVNDGGESAFSNEGRGTTPDVVLAVNN